MKKNNWTANTHRHFAIGMMLSLLFCYTAFNWTTYPQALESIAGEFVPEDLEPDIPITVHRKEPKVKPPVAFTPTDIVEPIDEPVFEDPEEPETIEDPTVEPSDIVAEPTASADKPVEKRAPILEPVIEEPEEDLPILIAEVMPVFDVCTEGNRDERKKCSDRALLQYINSQVRYPVMARENNQSGKVIARFTVGKDGKVRDPEILRDPGFGMGAEVLRILNRMPDWTPGRQNGRPVSVYFNIPVKFSLQ